MIIANREGYESYYNYYCYCCWILVLLEWRLLGFFSEYENLLVCFHCQNLWSWSFLPAFVQGQKGHNGYFNKQSGVQEYHLQHDHFKQIQEPERHYFPQWISRAIIKHRRCDLLAILDELHPDNFLIAEIGSLTPNPTFSSTISSDEKHLWRNWPSRLYLSGLSFVISGPNSD